MRLLIALAIIAGMLFTPAQAAAVTSEEIVEALELAETIDPFHDQENLLQTVAYAVLTVAAKDKGLSNSMTVGKIIHLSEAIIKAHEVTGLDWRVILAVSFVESRLCHERSLKGDKRKGRTGKKVDDYWAFGCMQVHFYWWGEAIEGAGLSKEDMLEYDNGIIVGSMILADYVERFGLRNGIRRYNGKAPESFKYRDKVLGVMDLIG